MVIKYTKFFHSKTLQNLPKFEFLVWKQTIWQPCSNSGNHAIVFTEHRRKKFSNSTQRLTKNVEPPDLTVSSIRRKLSKCEPSAFRTRRMKSAVWRSRGTARDRCRPTSARSGSPELRCRSKLPEQAARASCQSKLPGQKLPEQAAGASCRSKLPEQVGTVLETRVVFF
jgi:hypothetical protein